MVAGREGLMRHPVTRFLRRPVLMAKYKLTANDIERLDRIVTHPDYAAPVKSRADAERAAKGFALLKEYQTQHRRASADEAPVSPPPQP